MGTLFGSQLEICLLLKTVLAGRLYFFRTSRCSVFAKFRSDGNPARRPVSMRATASCGVMASAGRPEGGPVAWFLRPGDRNKWPAEPPGGILPAPEWRFPMRSESNSSSRDCSKGKNARRMKGEGVVLIPLKPIGDDDGSRVRVHERLNPGSAIRGPRSAGVQTIQRKPDETAIVLTGSRVGRQPLEHRYPERAAEKFSDLSVPATVGRQ